MVRLKLLHHADFLLSSTLVTLSGSILFILFGIIYLYEAFHAIDIEVPDISYYHH